MGDLVLTRGRIRSSKIKKITANLNPKSVEPHQISKVLSPSVYDISELSHKKIGKFHIQDLKIYITSNYDLGSDL